jgi:hypothetical protein
MIFFAVRADAHWLCRMTEVIRLNASTLMTAVVDPTVTFFASIDTPRSQP